jgi:mannose PTS system EIIC component
MSVLLASLISGLVFIESWPAGQFLLGRPAIFLPLIGCITGFPILGIWMGICLDLLFLRRLPMGNTLIPEPGMGGLLAFFLVGPLLKSNIPEIENQAVILTVGLSFAWVFSYLAGMITELQRQLNGIIWAKLYHRFIASQNTRMLNYILPAALLQTYFFAVIVSFLMIKIAQPFVIQSIGFVQNSLPLTGFIPGLNWLLLVVSAGGLLNLYGLNRKSLTGFLLGLASSFTLFFILRAGGLLG